MLGIALLSPHILIRNLMLQMFHTLLIIGLFLSSPLICMQNSLCNKYNFDVFNEESKRHFSAIMEVRWLLYDILKTKEPYLNAPTELAYTQNARLQTKKGLAFYLESDDFSLATPWGEIPCLDGILLPEWSKNDSIKLITHLSKYMEVKKTDDNYYEIASISYYKLPTFEAKEPWHNIFKNYQPLLQKLHKWYQTQKAIEQNSQNLLT